MRRIRAFLLRLAGVFQHTRKDLELNEELETVISLHTEDNFRAGMSPEEARRQAILHFGSIVATKEECRDRRGLPLLETFLRDVRYAVRSLAVSPVFAVLAIATLAFGIGAGTAMFTVAQAVLLRPLPYSQPERLFEISEVDRLAPSTGANVASGDFADWRRMNTVFSGMAAYGGVDERGKVRFNLYLTGAGETRVLKGLVASANLFDVLGVAPLMGRNFATNDHAAILTHSCWQNEFASDPHIIGRSITLNGERRDVAGVMPPGFFFPSKEVDVFIPPGDYKPDRTFHDEGVVARLRPGVSLEQARAEMATIGARLQHAYPETNSRLSPRVENWHSALSTSSRPALLMLFSAVAILFAIVCSNVAHLQLGRAAARVQEFSIRKALGASRPRLLGQLLTENLLLSLLGGVLGLFLAKAGCAALLLFAPEVIPSYADLRLDSRVIFFNVVITLMAPLLFGIGPALSCARPESMRERAASSSRSNRRTRDWLVAGEVALSVVLVVCAGLLVRSLVRLENVDLGFVTERALSFRLDLGDLVASEELRGRRISEIERMLLEQPGIEAAGATARPVLGGGSGGEASVTILGHERPLRLELITPGYFQAMRARLIRGRFPSQFDTSKSSLVVVVNSAFERTYFPEGNTVGKQITLGARGQAMIVGVVSDLKQEAIDRPAQPAGFISSNQIIPSAVTFIVRGSGDPTVLTAAARLAVHSVDPVLPLTDVAMLDRLVRTSISDQRIRTSLLSLIAVAALCLAAIGVYGVLAYSVARRSVEISIRMALGASLRQLFSMVVLDGLRPVLFGAVLGFAGAYGAGRFIQSLLFDTVPADPATYVTTALVLASAAICACTVPAIRAIRLDPMVALRRQ